jgi:hypothetical protein
MLDSEKRHAIATLAAVEIHEPASRCFSASVKTAEQQRGHVLRSQSTGRDSDGLSYSHSLIERPKTDKML